MSVIRMLVVDDHTLFRTGLVRLLGDYPTLHVVGAAGSADEAVTQAVALQPGVSRSGVTITAGRGIGLDRPSAARFSFLLSLPIILGAGLFKAAHHLRHGLPPGTTGPFLWGTVASAISGFLVIWALMAYLRRRDFAPFVVYRLAMAGLVLGLIASGVRAASGL